MQSDASRALGVNPNVNFVKVSNHVAVLFQPLALSVVALLHNNRLAVFTIACARTHQTYCHRQQSMTVGALRMTDTINIKNIHNSVQYQNW
jgi:hypothetical protein